MLESLVYSYVHGAYVLECILYIQHVFPSLRLNLHLQLKMMKNVSRFVFKFRLM